MRVLLSTTGSRGDVEPLVALAVRLRALGAEVRMCAPPTAEERLAEVGVPLVPVGPRLREMLHDGMPPPSPESERRIAAEAIATQFDKVPAAAEGCDAVVATGGLIAAVAVRSVAEKLGIPYFYAACSQPYLPSPHYPPPIDEPTPPDVTDNRTLWNLRKQRFCERFSGPVNSQRAAIGLPPVENIFDYGYTGQPWLAADPVLAPLQPTDLDAVQTGAWMLPDERPLPAALEAFLAAGSPPAYVGFGSSSGPAAGDAARVAIEAICAQGRRIVLSRGADLAVPDRDDCFAVDEVNLQVLFGRVAVAVHHGSAGTTHVAARAGVPQVVVPQDTDQPYFAGRVAELGIGVAHDGPTPTVESLSAALATALAPETRARAKAVAGTTRADGTTVAAELLRDTVSRESDDKRRGERMSVTSQCRICDGTVNEFIDFGRQPLSDAFVDPGDEEDEFFFRLAAGICDSCTMVQLMEEVPRHRMFHEAYPYLSSGSAYMRTHFEELAKRLLATELTGEDAFIVELGSNDGVMLKVVAEAGVRHLGVDPSGVADLAAAKGIRVRKDFFEEATAADIRQSDRPADVIYAANTLCHIPYMESILKGVNTLLGPNGVFVFEDPYLGDIVERTSFDQIYDEHFFFFTARAVQEMARRNDLELVDVERISVHGGEVRYTLALAGARKPTRAVAELLAWEAERKLAEYATLARFAAKVKKNKEDLIALLTKLRAEGKRVVGYGATAKSATVTNFCGITPDLVEFISDTTPAKQGRLSPGQHIPVREHEEFAGNHPDYALLFAWNHADEIINAEQAFRDGGGQWILYVPNVHVS